MKLNLAVIDSDDPLTRSLRVIYKRNPRSIPEIEKNLIPVLESIAVETGFVDSNTSVQQALAILCGTVSLYLSDLTKGGDNVEEWATAIEKTSFDFQTLFRYGYTMMLRLAEIDNSMYVGKKPSVSKKRVVSLLIELSVPVSITDMRKNEKTSWPGYRQYLEAIKIRRDDEKTNKLVGFILHNIPVADRLRLQEEADQPENNSTLNENIIYPLVWNLLVKDKFSIHVSYDDIAKTIHNEKKRDALWLEKKLARFKKRVKSFPPEKQTLFQTTAVTAGLHICTFNLKNEAKEPALKRINDICFNLGITDYPKEIEWDSFLPHLPQQ
jgi:hypothetical protein